MFKLLTFTVLLVWGQLALSDDLQTQLNAQQRSMLMMQNNLQQMQNDLQTVNGQLEELHHELSKLREQLNAAAAATQNQVAPPELNPKAADSAGNSSKASAQSTAVSEDSARNTAAVSKQDADEGRISYEKAYALVNKGDLNGAEQAFAAFIQQYPQHQLVANAWYWQGQVQYKKSSYEQARVSFLNAAKYNDSPKRPDALFKLGKISEQLGDKDKARRYYEVLIKTYPNDTSAVMAQRELSK